uniref:Uncharacterized protein n=1 Tax=Sinocyclocheilus rhinocerous TaxID=307959 RepID=A0A673KQZ4_9TELE
SEHFPKLLNLRKSKIAVDAAVKFVKQLFRYEQWSTFSSLSTALISFFLYCSQNMEGRAFRKYELELRILEAVEHLMSTQRNFSILFRHFMLVSAGQTRSGLSLAVSEELMELAQSRHYEPVYFALLVIYLGIFLCVFLSVATTEDSSEESIPVRKSASSLFMVCCPMSRNIR